MIGMDSLGPQVKNDQHPFQIPANKKTIGHLGQIVDSKMVTS